MQIYSDEDIAGMPEAKWRYPEAQHNQTTRSWPLWIELYAEDFSYVCQHPLTYDRTLDPRDWATINATFGQELQIMTVATRLAPARVEAQKTAAH